MADFDRSKIKINKKKETRSKEISRMINEGGLGADKYYKIEKNPPQEKESGSQKDEKND